MDGWMERWIDEWMDRWIDEWMVINSFLLLF